ncbi:MAG: penicillin-binding protein 2 [Candidatus Moranbacteria bacterium]|nr:penicillin-binding protein 2 [Candidatus Moranbacteria bacterium]
MKFIKKRSPNQQTSDKNWRIHGLAFFVLAGALIILGKLYLLQVARHGIYTALAENQHSSKTQLEAARGEIFLQDESEPYPIAVNREMQMAYAVPREMKDAAGAIEALASILSLDQNFVRDRLDDPNDMFEILKHKLTDEEAQKIRDAKIAGIYLTGENFRYYPAGELAAQTIGFVGSSGDERRGMYGLEASWQNELKGTAGMRSQEGDARGRWIPVSDRNVEAAQNGGDLILTINHTVQFEVEKILKQTMEKFSAEGASAIVMDPKTGKILAMANQPSFNPNDFSSTEDISRFSNPAISAPYESGSVFKAVTEAIGIDDGKINGDTTYVDTGVVNEAGYSIRNSDLKANGVQTMTEVLEKSLNTGVIYIEKLVGNQKFADYVERFGFGQKTGIELPGEVPGNTRNLANPKTTINFFTASFGQGISVTPLQLVSAFSVLANGGTLMKPQIVDEVRYSDGSSKKIEPEEVRQVITASSAEQTSEMLRSVVINGHGKQADVPGYLVGGKTGTAQVAKAGAKGYEEGINIGSFAGYAPTNDAKFVLIVKIINPRGVEWAESSAAPTFGKIMKFLLEYYNIKPTEDPTISPMYAKYKSGFDPLAIQSNVIAPSMPIVAEKEKDNKTKKDTKKAINTVD